MGFQCRYRTTQWIFSQRRQDWKWAHWEQNWFFVSMSQTKSSLRALQISINQWSYATLSDVHKGLYHDHLKPVEVLMFRKSVISVQSWNPPAALQVPDVTWIQQLCCAFLNMLPLQRPQSTEQRLRTGRKRGRISGHALGNSAVGMSCLGGTAQDTVEGNTMLLDRYME